jgi:hypothetical protein
VCSGHGESDRLEIFHFPERTAAGHSVLLVRSLGVTLYPCHAMKKSIDTFGFALDITGYLYRSPELDQQFF